MTNADIDQIAGEEYDRFYQACLEEAIDRHDGDKVAAMNEMQGFDYPDCISSGDDFFEFCSEAGFEVPEGAIGGTEIHSEPGTEPVFFFEDTQEEVVRVEARKLYYGPEL